MTVTAALVTKAVKWAEEEEHGQGYLLLATRFAYFAEDVTGVCIGLDMAATYCGL